MGLAKTTVKAAIMALGLAIWTMFAQPAYYAILEAQGRSIGVAETALGFFFAIMMSWGVAALATKRMDHQEK